MHLRDKLPLLLIVCCTALHGEAFLLPILFPLSIKITFHSNSKPTPPPQSSYHFEAVPVYREVVVKGSAHISPPKFSYDGGQKYGTTYGGGQKYGTAYGDGHTKVYTEEPHIRGPKYASGYGSSGTGGSIDGHFSISSYPATPSSHYKGSPYDSNSGSHFKGVPYSPTDYKGHSDGVTYVSGEDLPPTHYKGTAYDDKIPPTHDKGTPYDDKVHSTHYKGTAYEEEIPTHYKGTSYEDGPTYYKGSSPALKPQYEYKPNAYIKPVGGYKLSDYIDDDKSAKYPDDDASYTAVPPGKTYAEIEAAHKASHSPKAYSADQYSDIGSANKEYEHDASYIDDTLPAYKSNIPRPRIPRPRYKYQASSSRYDRVLAEPKQTKVYAGFGTSIYGDSYAKVAYVPKTLRISIRAYAHK